MHFTHWNVVAVHAQGLFILVEGRLLVILLQESCTNTLFFTLLSCGNRFIKAIRYSRQQPLVSYCLHIHSYQMTHQYNFSTVIKHIDT